MGRLEGYRSQITAIIGAVFTAVSAIWPDLIPESVQRAILEILLFLFGWFFAAKVQRGRE